MNEKFISMDTKLYQYLLSVSLKESESLRQLRYETQRDPMALLQISPDQGQFMALLVKLTGAKRILEIGTYTGYSAMAMCLAIAREIVVAHGGDIKVSSQPGEGTEFAVQLRTGPQASGL